MFASGALDDCRRFSEGFFGDVGFRVFRSTWLVCRHAGEMLSLTGQTIAGENSPFAPAIMHAVWRRRAGKCRACHLLVGRFSEARDACFRSAPARSPGPLPNGRYARISLADLVN